MIGAMPCIHCARMTRVSVQIFLFVTSLTWVGCGRDDGKTTPLPERPPPQVTLATAITQDVPVYLDAIGKTVAVEVVSIVPQVGGKLVAAHVGDGEYVKRGAPLFEIDPRPFEAALAAAAATLTENRADLDLSRIEFKRMQDLASQGAANQLEFDRDRVALAVTEAKVAAAEAAVKTAELNLEYTKILSPIDGRAGARSVDPGNVVKANDAPIQVIRRLDPIYVEFTVTDNDLGTVRKYIAARGLELGESPERGLRVEIDVPGDSSRVLMALGSPVPTGVAGENRAGPRQGELTFLDNTVDAATGTVRLRATVANVDHYFWPGQFVNVRLVLTTKKDAVLVPAQAQQVGQQGPYVYVVTSGSTAELRPITLGQHLGELTVVEQGLQNGERVVITGHIGVVPGGKVHVINEVATVARPSAP